LLSILILLNDNIHSIRLKRRIASIF
jgi:hypothetical protein